MCTQNCLKTYPHAAVEPELTAEEFLEEKLEIARSELQCDSKCGHRDKSDLL